MAGGWDVVKLIQPFLSDSGHFYWHWNPVVVSYLAVWNQIQGWIQDFLIATGSILQSGGDACLTADPGVASSIPARYHTFVEIDHEIISTVILLPSADLFKKGCCQLQAKVCAQITG